MSFFESFEEYALRTGAKCTCSSKKIWSWDHAPGCATGLAYVVWSAENAALWNRLRSSPLYDSTKAQKLSEKFR